MDNHSDEVRTEVERLRETGEYERYASHDADVESARLAETVSEAIELSDEDADDIWSSLPEDDEATPETHRDEAARAIARSRGAPLRPGGPEGAENPEGGSVTRGEARALRDWFTT